MDKVVVALKSSPGPKVNSGVKPRDGVASAGAARGMETKSSNDGGASVGGY